MTATLTQPTSQPTTLFDMSGVLGFSGTLRGMSHAQLMVVTRELKNAHEFHHGDALGSDLQAHRLAEAAGLWTVAHPSLISAKRAFCKADVIHAEQPPIVRNRIIVNSVGLVICTPGQRHEVLRSGTWATIRWATKQGKPLLIVYPDGSEERRNGGET